MVTEPEIRLGIVGCGGISHAHAAAAQSSPENLRFVACCDIRDDVANQWAAKYGCDAAYTDCEEMIRNEDLDGVLLATWPIQHREQIETCLAAGVRHILCEKALVMTGKEAVEIWELVTSAGAFLMEGFMYRHHPAIRRLEQLLAEGELGPVDHVRAVFDAYEAQDASPDDPTRNWRQRLECGGGIPYDRACYCINACGHFAGALPTRVHATGHFSQKYGVLNRLYGVIDYANGCVGVIESSKLADFSQQLQIACAHGRLELPMAWTIYSEITITRSRSAGWAKLWTDAYVIGRANAYQLQLENFAAVIRGEAQPKVPLIESVANIFVIDALFASVREKRAVDVKLPDLVLEALAESKEGSR